MFVKLTNGVACVALAQAGSKQDPDCQDATSSRYIMLCIVHKKGWYLSFPSQGQWAVLELVTPVGQSTARACPHG